MNQGAVPSFGDALEEFQTETTETEVQPASTDLRLPASPLLAASSLLGFKTADQFVEMMSRPFEQCALLVHHSIEVSLSLFELI